VLLSKIQPIPSTFANNPEALGITQELISGAPITFFDMQANSDEEEKKGSGDDFVESKNDNFSIKADSMSTLRFVVYNSQSVEISPSGLILKYKVIQAN